MKKIKSIVSLLLSLIIAAGTVSTYTVSAAEENASIILTSNVFDAAEYAISSSDKQITFTFMLQSDMKIITQQSNISYDGNVLTPASVNTKEVCMPVLGESGTVFSTKNENIIKTYSSNYDLYDFTEEAVFITFTFDILSVKTTNVNFNVDILTGTTLNEFSEFEDEETDLVYYQTVNSDLFKMNVKVSNSDSEILPKESDPTIKTKKNAFSGDEIWVDTAENPSEVDSTLPLVKMYRKSTGKYYFYLPETANLSSLPVYFSGYDSVTIGSTNIISGIRYYFESDVAYTLFLNGNDSGTVTFYKSDAPAMYLNTKEDLPTTTNAKNANGESISDKELLSTSGTLATSELGVGYTEVSLKKLKGRGNASWGEAYSNFGKYPYNITLDKKTKIFSTMNKGKKYCLLSNNSDEAYLRNTTSLALAQKIGADFTSSFQYADVYNNGKYIGCYLVTDKIEINSQSLDLGYNFDDLNEAANDGVDLADCNRKSTTGNINDSSTKGYKKWVEITEPTADEDGNPIDASAGDGSYLLEAELSDRFPNEISGFISNQGQPIVVKTPEYASKAQVDFISARFNEAEAVVYDENSTLQEIEEVIDVESFIKVYFIQEISKNLDACQTSFYFYYDSKIDNRIHAGPVWDFDKSYGNYTENRYIAPNYVASHTDATQWFANIKGIYSDLNILNFEARVMNHPEIWEKFRQMWNEEGGLYDTVKEYVNGGGKNSFDYYRDELEQSAKMNESYWGFIEKGKVYVVSDLGKDYAGTTQYLANWINKRVDWLNYADDNATPLAENATSTYSEWLDDAEIIDLGSSFVANIVNIGSGKNVALSNNNAVIWSASGNSDQLWVFERMSDGSYKITNSGNGYCLDVFGSLKYGQMNVSARPGEGVSGQRWFIMKTSAEGYALKPACSDCVLDVLAASSDNGANLQTYEYNGTKAQMFTINEFSISIGNDFYSAITVSATGKTLEADSSNAYFSTATGKDNQLWHFELQSDGSYKISNAANGLCLDVSGAASTAGTNVCAYESNDTAAQRWYVTKNGDSFVLTPKCSACVLDSNSSNNAIINTSSGSYTQLLSIEGENEPDLLLGDANLDGVVNIRDVTEVQKIIVGYRRNISDELKYICDVDHDGKVTINDATQIQRYCLKIITEF